MGLFVTEVQSTQNNASPAKKSPPLLYSRAQVQHMLGDISRHTLWRLEKRGKLQAVRLNPGANQARVFYRHDDVMALIGQTND